MQKHFNLSNKDQIDKWKSKGLSNQFLNALDTMGDVVLSKPIKSMHIIFKGKGTLLTQILFLKIAYLVQLINGNILVMVLDLI